MAEKYFDSGIRTASGFSVSGQSPLDKKYTVKTIQERDEHVTLNRAYNGMLVFVEDDQTTYQLRKDNEGNLVWKTFGFDQSEFESQVYPGLDSDSDVTALAASQGKVLDAKIKTHTENNDIHVTAEQKEAWDSKPNNKEDIGLSNVTNDAQVKRSEMGTASGVATLDEKGLIPASQLPSYVDDVVEVASFDDLPVAGEGGKIYITVDNNKTYRWGGTEYAEISSSIALGETQGTAYEGIKGKALADSIASIKDGTVTVGKAKDSEKVNGFTVEKAVPADAVFTDTTYTGATQQADGLMSKEDKNKLDNLSIDDIKVGEGDTTLAEKLSSIPAADIEQDATHKFVTDEQIQKWTNGSSIENATITTDGLMSKEDKQKIEGIDEGANKYVHPNDENTRHVTDAQIADWNAKASTDKATTTTDGLMSKEDKKKLDDLDTDDIKYKYTETADPVSDANFYTIITDNDTIDELDAVISGSGSLSLNVNTDVAPVEDVVNNTVNIPMGESTVALIRLNCSEVSKITAGATAGTSYKIKAYSVQSNTNQLALSTISDAISGNTQNVTDIDITIDKTEGEIALAIEAVGSIPQMLTLVLEPRSFDLEKTLTEKLNEPIKAENVVTTPNHQFVTQAEKDAWTNGSNVGVATETKNGLMSKEDKTKLNTINIKDVLVVDITLTAADWSEDTKSIEVSVPTFTGNSVMNIGPASGISKDEYNIMSDANLKSTVKENGVIIITYQDTKPTIDLHLSAMIFVK